MAVVINGTTGIDKVQDGSIGTVDIAADAITTPKIADTVTLGRRNLIINGDMKIAQRGDSVTSMASAGYFEGPDRFRRSMNQSGGHEVTRERTTEVPAGSGLSYSLKETITTAGDEVASKWAHRPIDYRIEGQDIYHLQHGTSSAKSVTLSFWVRSNKTGTASVLMSSYDSSSGSRHIAPRYTINASNTWEYKTITVAGDTGGSGIRKDHLTGFGFVFYGAAGAGYQVADQSSAWGAAADNWWFGCTLDINNVNDFIQFAGLQLEVGDTATPFEHLSYAEELATCYRYFRAQQYYKAGALPWANSGGGWGGMFFLHPVEMRASPTITQTAVPSYSNILGGDGPNGQNGYSTNANVNTSGDQFGFKLQNNASGSTIYAVSSRLQFNAEL